MNRKPVKSKTIKSIGYSNKILELQFKESGEVYQYFNIQEWIYKAFMRARSKGRFFNRFIKNMYEFNKISMN